MSGNGEQRSAKRAAGGEAAATVRPGALTELLLELVRPTAAGGGSAPPPGGGGSAPPPGGGGPGGSDPPSAPPPRGPSPGERIGRFEIVREIGRGGFGTVYEARDLELGREVAFKLVRRAGPKELKADRMLAEAEAAARLAHPNIVHLYDLGRCTYGPYLIMELLRGATLAERLGEGRLAPREALRVGVEASRGVAHAHAQGVVHRDLKPGNVFVCEDGQVKLLDFGLAQVFGREGARGGTPAYMAPEQARGESGDERSDVYALGVMLYELLAGKLPYEGEREGGVPEGGTAPEIAGAPAALQKVLDRLLARDPAERPQDGAAAHALLAGFQKTLEPRRRAWVAWSLTAAAMSAAAWVWQVQPRPLPPGRLLTAVADTENRTGDPDLDGVSDLLRSGLEQSKRVAIVARSRLVGLLGPVPPRLIGEAQAREASRKARAQLLVVPSVRPAGSGFEVTVRAVDLERDALAFTETERAEAVGTIVDALSRVAFKVRKRLHEDVEGGPRTEVPIREIVPTDPKALRYFSEGQRAESEAREDDAMRSYARAIAIDPGFLLPRLAVLDLDAYADHSLISAPARESHARVVRAGLRRLPARERAYAEFLLGEEDETVGPDAFLALIDRAIDTAPEDPRAYKAAIVARLYNRSDLAGARPYMEKYIAIAPPRDLRVPDLLVALGALDEALAWVRGWNEQPSPGVHFANLVFVHRARGEVSEALEAARRVVALEPSAVFGLRWAFVDADALDEAEALFARAGKPADRRPAWLHLRGRLREALALVDAHPPPVDAADARRGGFHVARAFLLAQRRDARAVLQEGERARSLGGGVPPYFCVAWPLALLGDEVGARRLASTAVFTRTGCLRLYRAIRSWKAGDREAALARLAAVELAASHLYRGEILAELARDREAIHAFRQYRRGFCPIGQAGWDMLADGENYPRSLYLEAAALERLGEREEARKVLGRLLHLWARADPDLPLLAQAKAMRERLARPGGG